MTIKEFIQFLKKHNVGEDYIIKIDKEIRGTSRKLLDNFFVDINVHFIHIHHKSKEILIE